MAATAFKQCRPVCCQCRFCRPPSARPARPRARARPPGLAAACAQPQPPRPAGAPLPWGPRWGPPRSMGCWSLQGKGLFAQRELWMGCWLAPCSMLLAPLAGRPKMAGPLAGWLAGAVRNSNPKGLRAHRLPPAQRCSWWCLPRRLPGPTPAAPRPGRSPLRQTGNWGGAAG